MLAAATAYKKKIGKLFFFPFFDGVSCGLFLLSASDFALDLFLRICFSS